MRGIIWYIPPYVCLIIVSTLSRSGHGSHHDGRVKRSVTAGSAEHAAVAAAQKKGGLDNILAAIDGPKTISTVRSVDGVPLYRRLCEVGVLFQPPQPRGRLLSGI